MLKLQVGQATPPFGSADRGRPRAGAVRSRRSAGAAVCRAPTRSRTSWSSSASTCARNRCCAICGATRSSNIADGRDAMTAPRSRSSMGDPAGIGPEIIAKAWARRAKQRLAAVLRGRRRARDRARVGRPGRADRRSRRGGGGVRRRAAGADRRRCAARSTPGQPDARGCALRAARAGTGDRAGARRAPRARWSPGRCRRRSCTQIGFTHPGQTEFVAERCGIAGENAVMMLAGPTLRVVPMTTHVPLAEVPGC